MVKCPSPHTPLVLAAKKTDTERCRRGFDGEEGGHLARCEFQARWDRSSNFPNKAKKYVRMLGELNAVTKLLEKGN